MQTRKLKPIPVPLCIQPSVELVKREFPKSKNEKIVLHCAGMLNFEPWLRAVDCSHMMEEKMTGGGSFSQKIESTRPAQLSWAG
jgi:hypothetical protein